MYIFAFVFLSVLAALGVVFTTKEILRAKSAKNAVFLCVSFKEDVPEGTLPDMLLICRTTAEEEEIIRRICANESRKVFIKRW
jgi:hypothetical protein